MLSKAAGQELTQSQLAELCNLDKTTMVVTLDALERAGLAERRPSSTDRRARIIAVTAGRRADGGPGRAGGDGSTTTCSPACPTTQRQSFVAGADRLAGAGLSTPIAVRQPPRRRAARVPRKSSG